MSWLPCSKRARPGLPTPAGRLLDMYIRQSGGVASCFRPPLSTSRSSRSVYRGPKTRIRQLHQQLIRTFQKVQARLSDIENLIVIVVDADGRRKLRAGQFDLDDIE